MEFPCKVVGYERTVSDSGKEGCRLYLEQRMAPGTNGEGIVTGRTWFNPEYVDYAPQLGDLVIIIPDDRNRAIAFRIIKIDV